MTIADYVGKAIQLFAQLGNDYSEWLAIEFMNSLQDIKLWDAIDSQAEGPLTFQDVLRFYAGTLVQRLNQQIGFSTDPSVVIPKFKQHPKTMAEMLAQVVQQIEKEEAIKEAVVVAEPGKQAMEEVEIPAEVVVVQPIEEEVTIIEMVVAVEPEEQAMKEFKQHLSVLAEIPSEVLAEVIQPIEEKVTMEEV